MKLLPNKAFDFLALLAGLLLPLAFAPFSWSPLAVICPALWFYSLQSAKPHQAFYRGLFFGIGFFGVGVWWVFISIRYFGHAPLPAAVILTSMLILYLSLYFALQGYVLKKYFHKNAITSFLAFAALWVLFELLRCQVLTGFPWLLLGYAQLHWPLAGLAPVGGIWLVSFATALTAGLFITFSGMTRSQAWSSLFGIILCWGFGAWSQTHAWTQPTGKTLVASLVQGNVPQAVKWQPDKVLDIIDKYVNLTTQHWASDLIIWPEGAVTVSQLAAADLLLSLDEAAKKHHTTVMLGIPILESPRYYNGMVAVGLHQGEYRKRRLVPFGEYLFLQPLSEIIMQYLSIPMSSFSAGNQHQTLLNYHDAPIATLICYESVFPNLVRSDLPRAQLLVGITDDSWFGDSFAAEQHLQMIQMRALETGRYVLSATNTGVSALITPKGEIIKSLAQNKTGVITATVGFMSGTTPWVQFGQAPLIGLLIALLLLLRFFISDRYPQQKEG